MAKLVFHVTDEDNNQVEFHTSEKEGKELVESYGSYVTWLETHNFKLKKAWKGKSFNRAPKPKIKFDGQTCPKCQDGVWDNREKKASGQFNAKSPDFSCKNKDCKWGVWPEQYELDSVVEDVKEALY